MVGNGEACFFGYGRFEAVSKLKGERDSLSADLTEQGMHGSNGLISAIAVGGFGLCAVHSTHYNALFFHCVNNAFKFIFSNCWFFSYFIIFS